MLATLRTPDPIAKTSCRFIARVVQLHGDYIKLGWGIFNSFGRRTFFVSQPVLAEYICMQDRKNNQK